MRPFGSSSSLPSRPRLRRLAPALALTLGLLGSASAHAEPPATRTAPSATLRGLPPIPEPVRAVAPPPPEAQHATPNRRDLAIAFELLSPGGGAGCFYRRRNVAGALVIVGSLLSGGLMLNAVQRDDIDATVVGAVAYGLMRTLGLVGAALDEGPLRSPFARAPDTAPPAALGSISALGSPSIAAPLTAKTLGFSYGFSF